MKCENCKYFGRPHTSTILPVTIVIYNICDVFCSNHANIMRQNVKYRINGRMGLAERHTNHGLKILPLCTLLVWERAIKDK